MRISFEKDNSIWYAVSYDQEWNGYVHSDLFWAEVSEGLGAYKVTWTDDFQHPEHFDTIGLARKHVSANYHLHTPHSQGRTELVKIKYEE